VRTKNEFVQLSKRQQEDTLIAQCSGPSVVNGTTSQWCSVICTYSQNIK